MELENEMLMHAARSGNKHVFEELTNIDFDQKDANGQTALILASRYHQPDMVKLLIEKNVNINATDNDGNSALMWAAFTGNLAIVELLIENRVSINQQRYDGATALMLAVMAGQKDIVKLLLIAGADPEICNNVGLRVLDLAQQQGDTETQSLLGL